jgi:hypothetical protein
MLVTLLVGFLGGMAGGIATKISEDMYSSIIIAIRQQPNVKAFSSTLTQKIAKTADTSCGYLMSGSWKKLGEFNASS